MNKIFFTSDTHFFHTNIIKYCNRPFASVEEMNEALINNWNKVVSSNDVVYHLGDLAYKYAGDITSIVKRLNGKKYLIRGNHDNENVKFYEDLGFTVLKNPPIYLHEYGICLSHKPIPDKMIREGYINIHGHIHDKGLNEVENEGICFYPKNLFSLDKHINVSVDVTDYRPISLEELLKNPNNN